MRQATAENSVRSHLAVAVIVVDVVEGDHVASVEALEVLVGIVHGGELCPHTSRPAGLGQSHQAEQAQRQIYNQLHRTKFTRNPPVLWVNEV